MKEHMSGWRVLFMGWLLLACLFGCQPDKNKPAASDRTNAAKSMKAIIQRRQTFEKIPSASGMELIDNRLYVIGDDSPFLYVLDRASLQLVDQIELFASGDFGSGRIPKLLKPDLECLTRLEVDGLPHLVAFGSGSAPNRARIFDIQLPTEGQGAVQVQQYSLQHLYQTLQADQDLLGGDDLNLEAAAATPDKLLLFQRATKAGPNLIIAFPRQDFVAYLTGARKQLPDYEAITCHLPQLAGLNARFSGAIVHDNRLFFTASVENTADAILDGEVLGSFVGWADLAAVKPGSQALALHTALVLDEKGETYKGKVESLVILDSPRAHTFRALAMTDNDNGQSDLLELELSGAATSADGIHPAKSL